MKWDDCIKDFLKRYQKKIIGIVIVIIIFIVYLIATPETIESGNGYKHQIGSFGECECSISDECTGNATHKINHFFSKEYYCDACWDYYGQEWFDKLSNYDRTKDKKCAWCNGTGYTGNGATNATEYVLMKTPCKHCNGKGTR